MDFGEIYLQKCDRILKKSYDVDPQIKWISYLAFMQNLLSVFHYLTLLLTRKLLN